MLVMNYTTLQVFSQNIFENYQSKEILGHQAVTMINKFDIFMKNNGITPPLVPGAKIATSYALIYWEGDSNNVVLPYWEELYPTQKEIFVRWKGNDAEEFFTSLFNWFFIPHELGHFILLTNPDLNLTPYESERRANMFALSFLLNENGNEEKIRYIEKSLEEILKRLPKIDFENMSEKDYFNANYNKLGNNPDAYGYFQFKFILDLLKTKEKITIKNLLRN
ncbi:MAG: hypothetical protein H6Q15_2375 [Bacteroidetes bacterium]|nr:hypothetical protein [Bacteroidota bacterium]